MAKNIPLAECAAQAERLRQRGLDLRQTFTCEHCGAKQVMEKPNAFYERGQCQECGKITNIKERGCSYLAISERWCRPIEGQGNPSPPPLIASEVRRRIGEITLARFYAKKAVKEQWRAEGLKVQNIKASKITEAANEYLDQHPAELMAFASARYQSFVESSEAQRLRNRRKRSQ